MVDKRPHSAVFTDAILTQALEILDSLTGLDDKLHPVVLDPFAGTGKGTEFLSKYGYDAWGVELEPEWAAHSAHVMVGNALALSVRDGGVDVVFTSPTYANRMADKDMRESVAGTYAKSLGRLASVDSSCHMQWGPTYRKFNEDAWAEAVRTLRDGGYFLLNCKNHIRDKKVQDVTGWHVQTLKDLGLTEVQRVEVPTPGLRWGQNSDARVDHESLVLLRK